MRFYCDASEGQDDNSARWLTLAGLMASDQFWGDFQTRWEVVLKDRYPRAPYLHMNPLVMREDPFERVVGWTDEKVSQLVLDAINFLSSINKRAFRAFVISIDVTAHQRLLAEGLPLGGDPVDIITSLCLDSAIKWYCAEHPDNIERLYVFFDQNEPHIKTLRDKWLVRQETGRCSSADGDVAAKEKLRNALCSAWSKMWTLGSMTMTESRLDFTSPILLQNVKM